MLYAACVLRLQDMHGPVAEVPVEDPGADLEAVRAVDRIVIITGKAEDVEDRLKWLSGGAHLFVWPEPER